MATRMRRGNSIIRGSGHGFQAGKARAGSILKRKSVDNAGKLSEEDVAVFDLVLLSEVSEAAVVKNIQNMYYENHIYVYIGNVVISTNPFKDLPIYDDGTIEKYRGRSAFDPKLPPHIFALADNVFSDMKWRGRDQVIIISGESGAGKTEASKKVMQYVAAVSGSSQAVNEVKQKLLTTNPVLESFGNAKTTRNDNSSRFGKYMDIQFNFKGDPVGGHITTYLLEKARVVQQGKGERNFHIFYQLLATGAGKSLGLTSNPLEYTLLKGGGDPKVRGIDDAKWFKDVEAGLANTGLVGDDATNIWQALAAILVLGQVTFKPAGEGSQLDAVPAELEKLVMGSQKQIEHALTHNTVVVSGNQVSSDLNPAQAADSRDTLCKTAYQRLFQYICDRVNTSIAADDKGVKAVIGVLDIYGFEIFEKNGFEQFCINYCNEKLQQLFIELTLKTEQDEYASEGIQWDPIDYFNNKVICDLIDGKKGGIVATLQEESIRPGDKSDKAWLENMTKVVGNHAHYKVSSGPKDSEIPTNAFKLVHYAGDVVYTIDGFLEKNTDTLFKDLAKLMYTSSNPVMKQCFPEGDESTWKGATKRPETASRLFVKSMDEMIQILNSKTPSYVRCIKPNSTKSPQKVEQDMFVHQVKYLGLVENVRVRRAGYCFRETYKDFLWRYRMLSSETFPSWSGSDKDGTVTIMNSLGIQPNTYQLGKTKIFIKHPKNVFRLEEERDDAMDKVATKLQMSWRAYLIRKVIGGWFNAMEKQFTPVKSLDGNNPTYGFAPSKVTFPKTSAQLKVTADFLKPVYAQWWARKMVGPLEPAKQDLFRVQLYIHTLLMGQKDGVKLSDLSAGSTSTFAEKVPPKLAEKFESTNGKAIFSDDVEVVNKGGKVEPKQLVVTGDTIYICKKWKPEKTGVIPLSSARIELSKTADSAAVVKGFVDKKGNAFDWVLNIPPEHLLQFVAKASHSKVAQILVQDTITYDNVGKGKPKDTKTLKFVPNPAGAGSGTSWNKAAGGFVFDDLGC